MEITLFADGRGPTRAEVQRARLLAAAPFEARALNCLVSGDSRDILRPVMNGSHVWSLAPRKGWVRTLSRYHRLSSASGGCHDAS